MLFFTLNRNKDIVAGWRNASRWLVDLLNWWIQDGGKRTVAVVLLRLGLLADGEPKNGQKRKKKEPTRQWIRRREERGAFHQLVKEITFEDEKGYRNFFRLSRDQFQFVADKIRPVIERKPQPYPLNVLNNNGSVEERLAVTLRFLATGDKFQSLEYLFRITR